MAALDKNLVKGWFVRKAKPLANQFAQWIDACWFKGETIPITDIEGLSNTLQSLSPPTIINLAADGSFVIPLGQAVSKMYMKSAADETVQIGTGAGLNDLFMDVDLTGNVTLALERTIVSDAGTQIFFSGITSATRIVIYMHTI
ncbi:MAG: hypothetical protein ACTHK8_19095 [Ginsengibacter sp.]